VLPACCESSKRSSKGSRSHMCCHNRQCLWLSACHDCVGQGQALHRQYCATLHTGHQGGLLLHHAQGGLLLSGRVLQHQVRGWCDVEGVPRRIERHSDSWRSIQWIVQVCCRCNVCGGDVRSSSAPGEVRVTSAACWRPLSRLSLASDWLHSTSARRCGTYAREALC
jgi:hypothetical protein